MSTDGTGIEWTDATWNPTRGCSMVSPGCTNCYAMRQAIRMAGPGQAYEGLVRPSARGPLWTGAVRLVPELLDQPLRWRRPRRIFVNSMSDLFHEALTDAEIGAVFGVMAASPEHTFQVLTKRSARMRQWFRWARDESAHVTIERMCGHAIEAGARGAVGVLGTPWPLPNVWLGVSAEDQERADERIPDLLATPAAVRFVSYEPALGPVDFRKWLGCDGCSTTWGGCGAEGHERCKRLLDWVIVGGESGPGARPFDLAWGGSVVRQCQAAGVACFVKQLGAVPQSVLGYHRLADPKGGNPAEWPADLRVRQWPQAVAA